MNSPFIFGPLFEITITRILYILYISGVDCGEINYINFYAEFLQLVIILNFTWIINLIQTTCSEVCFFSLFKKLPVIGEIEHKNQFY